MKKIDFLFLSLFAITSTLLADEIHLSTTPLETLAIENSSGLIETLALDQEIEVSTNITQNEGNPSMNASSSEQQGTRRTTITPPVNPIIKSGCDFWLEGDFLWWKATETGLDFVLSGLATPPGDPLPLIDRKFQYPHFEWDPGFRLAIGYNMPYDGWDLRLVWTRFYTNAQGSRNDHGPGKTRLFEQWFSPADLLLGNISVSSATWRLKLDVLDLILGREFYVSNYLTLRPNFGLKSGWIRQDFDIVYPTQIVTQAFAMENDFWGFGFQGGIDANWILGGGASIFNTAALSILYGNFDNSQTANQDGLLFIHLVNQPHAARVITDLGLGLQWDHSFRDDQYALCLKLGYEYHFFFGQNQFMRIIGDSNAQTILPNNGDLTTQGLVASAKVNF